jgi:predicted nucleotidyltransferase
MPPVVVNHAAVRRRLALAGRVVDRLRAGLGPSPAELRDAPYLEAWVIEPSPGADAREHEGRPHFSNAVSLRFQPQLVLTLREALARARGIKAAFVYGSVADGRDTAASDIDLMVIGADVTYADCFAGLLTAENLLKRPIHAQFVSAEDWRRKLARGSAFVTKVHARAKIFIFGSADDLQR